MGCRGSIRGAFAVGERIAGGGLRVKGEPSRDFEGPSAGLVRGGKAGEGFHNRTVIGDRLGKLMIEAFRMVRRDPAAAEENPLGDQ
jgi:hypothetical protein